jgi:hypothetical protein
VFHPVLYADEAKRFCHLTEEYDGLATATRDPSCSGFVRLSHTEYIPKTERVKLRRVTTALSGTQVGSSLRVVHSYLGDNPRTLRIHNSDVNQAGVGPRPV